MSLFYISLSYIENHKMHETLFMLFMRKHFHMTQLEFIGRMLTFS
jgi:hypothetical protein